jgi:hypothetical protein
VQLLDNKAYEALSGSQGRPLNMQQLASCLVRDRPLLKCGSGQPGSCITLALQVSAAACSCRTVLYDMHKCGSNWTVTKSPVNFQWLVVLYHMQCQLQASCISSSLLSTMSFLRLHSACYASHSVTAADWPRIPSWPALHQARARRGRHQAERPNHPLQAAANHHSSSRPSHAARCCSTCE